MLPTTDTVGSEILQNPCPAGRRQRLIDGVVEIEALP